jgi:HlyD family secretion protein
MKITADARLKRLEIRTVQAGVVHDMQVFTVDGVIGPGQVLMTIMPQQDDLLVETRLATADTDQGYEGQPATLMFTSFNMRTPHRSRNRSRVFHQTSASMTPRAVSFNVRVFRSRRRRQHDWARMTSSPACRSMPSFAPMNAP